MKRQLLSTLLVFCMVLTMLICPTFATSVFPDVDEYTEYAEAVGYISEVGIMVGDENGNFNPNKTLTRAEMATIICKMLDMTENLSASSAFSDVPTNHWANRYIGKATELGILSGYGNGNFGPYDILTYEQALTMIIRMLGLQDEAISAGGYPNGYIEIACEYGYTSRISAEQGDQLARWQVAIILYNILV